MEEDEFAAIMGFGSFSGRLPKPKRRRARPHARAEGRPDAAGMSPSPFRLPAKSHGLPFQTRTCVAPMVGCSDLAFRKLCRRHGAELVWTEMFPAKDFASAEYRERMFQTDGATDRPLVVQLCGHDPDDMVRAGMIAQAECDCVEINLGCPQRHARLGLFGAYLLAREHWPKVFAMVGALKQALTVPVACKIRILTDGDETVEFCKRLEEAGCDMLTIHGRQLLSDKKKRRRHGPADLDTIARVKQVMRIPVISNGNVRSQRDWQRNLLETGCDGVMVAEAVLANPALFGQEPMTPDLLHRLACEYLELAASHPPPTFDYARAHIRALLRKKGAGKQMRFEFMGRLSVEELRGALDQAKSLADLAAVVEATLGQPCVTLVEGDASETAIGRKGEGDQGAQEEGVPATDHSA